MCVCMFLTCCIELLYVIALVARLTSECLLCVYCCLKCFTWINLFPPYYHPLEQIRFFIPILKMKRPRCSVYCASRSHSWDVKEPRFRSRQPGLRTGVWTALLRFLPHLSRPFGEGRIYRAVEWDSAMGSEDGIQTPALTPALYAVSGSSLHLSQLHSPHQYENTHSLTLNSESVVLRLRSLSQGSIS